MAVRLNALEFKPWHHFKQAARRGSNYVLSLPQGSGYREPYAGPKFGRSIQWLKPKSFRIRSRISRSQIATSPLSLETARRRLSGLQASQ